MLSRGGAAVTASYRDDVIVNEVESNHLGRLTFIEVAKHRIAYLFAESDDIVGLRENRLSQSSGGETAFGGFGHNEDNLVHATP